MCVKMKRHTVLGERLRELREKRGLSQADFGKRTGLGHSYISGIENGQIVPDLDILEKMTTALSVPLYTLFLTNQDFLLQVTHGMGLPDRFEAV
jgi:transcriptional regulator with XRE-family HTH domain